MPRQVVCARLVPAQGTVDEKDQGYVPLRTSGIGVRQVHLER
jgi:hypothetical protein